MAIFDQKFSLWTFTFGFVYFSAKMCKTISSIRFSGYYNFWPKNNLLGKRIQIFANFWIGIIFIVQKKSKQHTWEVLWFILYMCPYLISKKNILFERKISYLNVILKKKYYTVKIFKERRVIEKTKYLLKSPQKGRMKKNLYFMNVNV